MSDTSSFSLGPHMHICSSQIILCGAYRAALFRVTGFQWSPLLCIPALPDIQQNSILWAKETIVDFKQGPDFQRSNVKE